MEKQKLVIFDFDGVLADTMPLWFAINSKTNPGFTYEQFSRMSHGNSYHAYQSGNYEGFTKNPDAQEEYDTGINAISAQETTVTILQELAKRYLLSIVSSGSEPTIRAFLNRHHADGFFAEILGFQTHTSKVEKINLLLSKHRFSSADAVLVTDTLGDIREAHEAGIPSIGVTWGLHTANTLREGSPEAIVENPSELPTVIEKILQLN